MTDRDLLRSDAIGRLEVFQEDIMQAVLHNDTDAAWRAYRRGREALADLLAVEDDIGVIEDANQ